MQRDDPIAVELHRRSLDNIAREMTLALKRTSGSPVVTDSGDFATCVLDRNGEQLALSAAILFHASSSVAGTRTVLDDLANEDEAPRPGDGWIVNDPYEGGAM